MFRFIFSILLAPLSILMTAIRRITIAPFYNYRTERVVYV